jgi:hypothetical protein
MTKIAFVVLWVFKELNSTLRNNMQCGLRGFMVRIGDKFSC